MNTWVSPWAIGTHFSPQHMGTFLPSDSHLMVYFTTWEMHGFSHQFLIALENAAKSTLWTLILFFHSMIVPTCFKIWWFLERENRKSGKINSFFFWKKEISIPGMLEFKAKYIKRRRGHRCNFTKRRNINICSAKVCHPTQIFNLMKIAASMVFGRKKSQDSIFKKGSQFNSHFLLPCDVVVVSLHRLLSHLLTLSYWICWYYEIKLYYSQI